MNILVCMKAVPGTTAVQVDGQYRLKRDGVTLQWNVADESALEAAARLKGTGTVTVVTMGPAKLQDNLKELLARGADRAVLVTDRVMAGADTRATARALAAAARHLGSFDLILCGRRAIDGETGQVPAQLAAALALPCVSDVEAITADGCLTLTRRLEDGLQTLQAASPLVASLCAYAYPLRLPGILALRKAKNKAVEVLSAADLGLDPAECGLAGSLTRVIAMENTFPGLRKGPKYTDVAAGLRELKTLLGEVRP